MLYYANLYGLYQSTAGAKNYFAVMFGVGMIPVRIGCYWDIYGDRCCNFW